VKVHLSISLYPYRSIDLIYFSSKRNGGVERKTIKEKETKLKGREGSERVERECA
jgi:hypothetical protein